MLPWSPKKLTGTFCPEEFFSYSARLPRQVLPACCTTYDEKQYRNIEELMNHSTLTAKFIGARISDLI